jgi:hypothetical protein
MSDSTNTDLHAQVHEFVTARIFGQMTPDQFERLEHLLHTNREARRIYVRYIEATLVYRAILGSSREVKHAQAVASEGIRSPIRTRSSLFGFLHRVLRVNGESPVSTALTWLVLAIVLSGTVLSAVFIAMMVFGVKSPVGQQVVAENGKTPKASSIASPASKPVLPAPSSSPVARLIRMIDCRWEKGAPAAGDDISVGRKLALKSGLAEIIFQGGARTLLEGPAMLEIRSRMGVYLQQGKFTVTIENPMARGFEVRAPGMKYTDLGTEFGVFVAANGEQEVHVFRGNVQAEEVGDENSVTADEGSGMRDGEHAPIPQSVPSAPRSDDSHPSSPVPHHGTVLSANQAIHVAAPDPSGKKPKQVERIAANEKQFVRDLTGPLPLFSTGVNLDRGAPDPHWEITAISTEAKFTSRQAVVAVPAKSYLPDARDKAQWISDARAGSTMPKGCRWTLRTRFDLSGFDPATASIEGKAAVDNYLIEMRLNGKKVPLPKAAASEWFARGVPIKVEGGFTSGVNTLELVIENADSGEKYNPMAICVDWHGTATRMTKPDTNGATSIEH